MRLSVIVLGLVCLCGVVIGIAAPAIQEDGDVRGAFLTSRPKDKPANTGGATSKPSRRRPKTTPGPAKPDKTPDKTPGKPGPAKPRPSEPVTPVNARRLGLGVTLFMRDSNGLAVRVDPDHVFQKGDRVRVLLETNTDGYLYIFNTTDNGPATMIYPDVNLDEAGNYLQAHVPFEIPTSLGPEERLRWFAFDETAGTEHLFFVFTREPLQGIPIDDDLIAFCRNSKCPVQPNEEVWAAVQKELQEPLKTDRTAEFGKAETPSEKQATTRGLGLAKDDPQPSVVMMASSPRARLVATLDLIHK
jgi:Domain of unknown function (DUF4384)